MIILIGAGEISKDYAKVLKDLGQDFEVISRSKKPLEYFNEKYKSTVHHGGIENYNFDNKIITHAIVATPIESLYEVGRKLISKGIKNILLEKPGPISKTELKRLQSVASKNGVNIYIAFNRRFYQSVIFLKKILLKERILGINFEITEWPSTIDDTKYSDDVLNKWILSNSSHVIDTVLSIGGKFKELNSYQSGSSIKWHPAGDTFIGSGITEKNIPFTYFGYWNSAGRWGIEIFTDNGKFILKPLESLQYQEKNTVQVSEYPGINYELDKLYKPGLYLQTKAFLYDKSPDICSIQEQLDNFDLYKEIGNY